MIKNIIFDVDGVIRKAKSARVDEIVPLEILKKYNKDYGDMSMKQYFANYVRNNNAFTKYDKGEITLTEMIKTASSLTGEPEEIIGCLLKTSCKAEYNFVITPTINMIERLKEKGFKIFILSNMSKEKAQIIREILGTKIDLFDDLIFSCDVACVKPELKIYSKALEKFNISAHESLFIDDRLENLLPFTCLGGRTFLFDLKNLDYTIAHIENLVNNEIVARNYFSFNKLAITGFSA